METRSEFIMAPEDVAPEHCQICNVAGFSLELETVKAHRARMVANVIAVKKPPWMEWTSGGDFGTGPDSGLRWIEKCNMNVLIVTRERVFCWAGHVV